MARRPLFLHEGKPLVEGTWSLETATSLWQGVPLAVRSICGPVDLDRIHAVFPSIALCLSGHGYNDVWFGRSVARLPFLPGVLVIHEGGFEASHCEWRGSADEVISIQVPSDILSELTHGEVETLELQTKMPFKDESLSALIIAMRDELRRDCSSGRMFAQGLSMALIGYLRSRYCTPAPMRRAAGKFSQRDMRRIVEYVTENLPHDIGIDDLSSLLSLSSSQFSRLFKSTVGISPYQYLQQKRIERALEMMRGRESLKEIAQNVGLTSQSHFTKVFREITGVTPAQARSGMG